MSNTKKVLAPFHAIDAGDMGADIASEPTNSQFYDNIGIYVKWTSSDAVGTIAVEGSINGKYVGGEFIGDWEPLDFSPALAQPNSDNGSYLININQLPYPWYRVTYDRSSGSGTLDVWFSGKSV